MRFHIVKAGFIIGTGGGSGTLNFKGRQYRLDIGGINVGTIGAALPPISELRPTS